MKPARWAIHLGFATHNAPVWGEPTQHVFVDDSKTPICMPAEPGSPGPLHEPTMGRCCMACWDLLKHPAWSSVPYGKRRVWVASVPLHRHDAFSRGAKQTRGFAENEADALEKAHSWITANMPRNCPVKVGGGGREAAEKYVRELRAEERAKKTSTATGTQVQEYVYLHHKSFPSFLSNDFVYETERYEVTRKTPKRVFVKNARETYETASGATVLRTWSLDRAALERGTHRWGWTLNPMPPADRKGGAPGWAEVLGVKMPCSLADAKRAFRSAAKTAHPDHGGTPEAFQRVKAAFDAASQVLQ